jgi:CheY-like chemotaxis protein
MIFLMTPLVLVVDDNKDAADSLAHVLAQAGYRVDMAYGGREAIDAASQSLPDAVVLDIAMPGFSGYEVARALSGLREKRPVLIAITGLPEDATRLPAQFAGFDHYFTKPVDLNELLGVLARISPSAPRAAPRLRRVLLADDNRDWTDEMVAQLREAGYWVRAAYDGQQALEIARLFSPEIVILDARMPRMGGHATARIFKRHPKGTRPLLIAVSGYEEERAPAADAGFDCFLAKPVDVTALAAVIAERA